MTNVYFVRHAEPNYENHDDASREFSSKGVHDRMLVTEFLMDKDIHAMFSSPYKRAIDTIREFAERKGMEILTTEDFRERKTPRVAMTGISMVTAVWQMTEMVRKITETSTDMTENMSGTVAAATK